MGQGGGKSGGCWISNQAGRSRQLLSQPRETAVYEAINSIPRLRLTTVSVLPAPDHSSEGKGLHTHIEVYDNVYMKILRKWTSVIGRHITSVPKCSLS